MRGRLFLIVLLLLAPGAGSAAADGFEQGLERYQSSDFFAAREVFLPLARSGDARAQFALGVMYETGKGVDADKVEAWRWFKLAADQGHGKAAQRLDALSASMTPQELALANDPAAQAQTPAQTPEQMRPQSPAGQEAAAPQASPDGGKTAPKSAAAAPAGAAPLAAAPSAAGDFTTPLGSLSSGRSGLPQNAVETPGLESIYGQLYVFRFPEGYDRLDVGEGLEEAWGNAEGSSLGNINLVAADLGEDPGEDMTFETCTGIVRGGMEDINENLSQYDSRMEIAVQPALVKEQDVQRCSYTGRYEIEGDVYLVAQNVFFKRGVNWLFVVTSTWDAQRAGAEEQRLRQAMDSFVIK